MKLSTFAALCHGLEFGLFLVPQTATMHTLLSAIRTLPQTATILNVTCTMGVAAYMRFETLEFSMKCFKTGDNVNPQLEWCSVAMKGSKEFVGK